MNKKILVLSAALLTILSSTVMAQESVIYLDVRPNDSGSGIRTITGTIQSGLLGPFLNDTVNGGKRGQGQIMYLEPKANDGWESVNSAQKNGASFPNFDGDLNHSTGDLWIYMDVNDDAGATGTGDVISSVGLDIDTRLVGATMRNKIASMAVTLDNGGTVFNSYPGGVGTPWNNKVDGNQVPVNDPPDWEKAKAVRVPVDPGPMYNAALGIQPRAQGTVPSYRLGKIRLTAGTRNCTGRTAPAFTDNSTYDIYLEVNNLLITRVFSNSPGDSQENLHFGYNGATSDASGPGAATSINGNVDGDVSDIADGRVQVRMKGDFNGDGNVTGTDNGGYVAALNDATDNQLATYLGDFNGNNTVTGTDSGSSGAGGVLYLHSQTRGGILSCP